MAPQGGFRTARSRHSDTVQWSGLSKLYFLPDKINTFLGLASPRRGFSVPIVDTLRTDLLIAANYIQSFKLESRQEAVLSLLSLQDGAFAESLLRLLAEASRVSLRDPSRPERSSTQESVGFATLPLSERLSVAVATCRLFATFTCNSRASPSPALADFFQKLLAMQTFQACARQLAEAAELLHRHQQDQQDQQDHHHQQDQQDQRQRQQQPSDVAAEKAGLLVLQMSSFLLQCMPAYLSVKDRFLAAVDVAAVLQESHILEHAARLLLLLPASEASKVVARSLLETYNTLNVVGLGASWLQPASERQLFMSTSGPCTEYAAMTLGLAAVCEADGGPTYGLPEELLTQGLPWPSLPRRPQAASGSSPSLYSPDITAAIALTTALAHRAYTGTVSRRTCIAVLLRVCRLAMAPPRVGAGPSGGGNGASNGGASGSGASGGGASSGGASGGGASGSGASGSGASGGGASGGGASGGGTSSGGASGPDQAAAGAGAVGAAPGQEQPAGFVMRAEEGGDLAVVCLGVLREVAMRRPGAWAQVADEWWSRTLALCREPERMVAKLQQLGLLLTEPHPTDDGVLPPAPSLDLAAALAAGLIPTLERLIRRSVFGSKTAEATILDSALAAFAAHVMAEGTRWRFLPPLLAYGDPRQAAALVASLGKVLRLAAHTGCSIQATDLIVFFVNEIFNVLKDAAEAAEAEAEDGVEDHAPAATAAAGTLGGDGAGGPGPAPQPQPQPPEAPSTRLPAQLQAMLSCAVQEWLPAFCRWVARIVVSGVGEPDVAKPALDLIQLLVTAARLDAKSEGSEARQGATGAEPGGSGAGGGGPNAGDPAPGDGGAGGWAEFLRQGVGAEELLGVLLRHTGKMDSDLALNVGAACVVLAAQCPETLQAATCGAAAVARATGGPSRRQEDARMDAGLPWPPSLLRALAAKLTYVDGSRRIVGGVKRLAQMVETWASGDESGVVGCLYYAAYRTNVWVASESVTAGWVSTARHLGPPGDMSSLLGGPTCANPLCISLAGDTELGVRLQTCGRCGGVGYCCRGCQTAHWRAGHKEACVLRARGGGAGGAAAAAAPEGQGASL